jgi:hypothetical protein
LLTKFETSLQAAENLPASRSISRLGRLRQHRRCLNAHVDRQLLLAALRVWRAELAHGESRAAAESARAREQECERITRALPWWVRRVSARAALARVFLHWRLACNLAGRREGFQGFGPNQEPNDQVHSRDTAVVLGTESVNGYGQGIQSFGAWPGNEIPDRTANGVPGGTGGSDEEDEIRTELRRIREIVQDRMLQIQQEVRICLPGNA